MKITNSKLTKLFFILLLFLLNCTDDYGDSHSIKSLDNKNFVELSQAKKISEQIFFKKESISNKGEYIDSTMIFNKTIRTINEVKNQKGNTAFYIINYNENGFILLSSDKRINPILAFSENGIFNVNESYPEGLRFWLDDTINQISDIQTSELEQSNEVKLAWKEVSNSLTGIVKNNNLYSKDPPIGCFEHSETISVNPLLSSTWDQQGYFNDQLPFINCNGSSFQVYAGCVPIAMAQVMKFYEYPTNYSWSSMPLTYGTSTTANFIKDIHNNINTIYLGNPSYDCSGTGVSSSANMGNVLKNKFGYSYANWADYNYNTVKTELNSNRPVILSGDNGTTGHMWVCDGYSETTFYYDDCTGATVGPVFHMNWGWYNGSYNGYYSYNNFNPAGTTYNNNKKMIYNIIP